MQSLFAAVNVRARPNRSFSVLLSNAKTVFGNGRIRVIEFPAFPRRTITVSAAVGESPFGEPSLAPR
jgi:3-phosphoglycerate kinase